MTDVHLVAYYAEGELLIMDKWNYKENISAARTKGIKYIVVKEKNIEKDFSQLLELAPKGFLPSKNPRAHRKISRKILSL